MLLWAKHKHMATHTRTASKMEGSTTQAKPEEMPSRNAHPNRSFTNVHHMGLV